MKMQMLRRLACVLLLLKFEVYAQFYATETEYHDKAQRLFVVETSRVLAWLENLPDHQIAEVTYQVRVDTNRVTRWKINWLDGSGKVLNEFRVNYPETLLKQGQQFYRDVFAQIQVQAKWKARFNLTTSKLNDGFWKGADLNGMGREEGLRAAFKLVATNSSLPEEQRTTQLAGLLTSLPMPSLSGGFTIDGALLARGAAWLALAESALDTADSPADENWAPMLFMAGRENAACSLWKDKVKSPSTGDERGALFQWWNCFLRRPTARAAFEFAADAKQRRFAMPMMSYYSRLEGLGTPLVYSLYLLYGGDPQKLARLHNYGGFLSASTDIAGGRLLEGAFPAIFRAKWLELLKNFTPSSLDYTGYVARVTATTAPDPLAKSNSNADDLSLVGLDEIAPVLELGYEQGVGKLIPVATVTARDLLNYGWEMNGLQMGSRYYFVKRSWGIPDLADIILRRATRSIEGQSPFFTSDEQPKVFNLQQTLSRLQMVDDLAWRVDVDVQPFAKDTSLAEPARMFFQRCWLRPREIRWQAWALSRANLCDDRLWLLQQYHAECGKISDVITLEYFRDLFSEKDFDAQPELQRLKEKIAESTIEPTELQIRALARKRYATLGNFEKAEAYEKIFWLNPDCNLEQTIFNNYILSGAWKSAKRFYKQIREVLSRDVNFSNWFAPQAWMMGFLTNDEELMSLAVEDSDTGSYAAMMMIFWHHAAHEDVKKAGQQLAELIERYESEAGPRSTGRTLQGFLPLMPALKDPKSPQHEQALDYFGKADTGSILRWILIQKNKLSTADAIRFLGGKETDSLRRLLVLRLQNVDEPRKQVFEDYMNSSGNKGVGRPLASWAAGQLEKIPTSYVQKDLKLPGAKTIRQAVQEKLREQ